MPNLLCMDSSAPPDAISMVVCVVCSIFSRVDVGHTAVFALIAAHLALALQPQAARQLGGGRPRLLFAVVWA